MTPRSPHAQVPAEHDGYVTEVEGGYEVAARGSVVAVYEDIAHAFAVVQEQAGDAPKWFVDRQGRTARI